uniref:RING-type domain-containing protein n=1 Tax=Macrostomum lignano TaxID=282301 RepID=A0A1I8F3H1_9PLAT
IAGLDELRRQVDWQREFCQSANDTVAEAAACGAIGDGLPESDERPTPPLLTELEAACTDLTGGARSVDFAIWRPGWPSPIHRIRARRSRGEIRRRGDLRARLIRRYAAAGGRSTSGSPAAAHRPRPACAAWRSAGPPTSAWPAACSTRPKPPRPLPPTRRGEARPGQPGRHHHRRLGTEFLDQRPGQSAESTASRLRAVDGLREQLDRAAGEANSPPRLIKPCLRQQFFDGNPGSLSGQLLCQWSQPAHQSDSRSAPHRRSNVSGVAFVVRRDIVDCKHNGNNNLLAAGRLPAHPWCRPRRVRGAQPPSRGGLAAALWRRRRLALRRRHLLSRLAGLRSGSRSSSTLATSAEQRRAALAAVEREVEQQLTDEATESINDDEASKKLRAELELCRRSCQSSLAGSQAEDSADTRNGSLSDAVAELEIRLTAAEALAFTEVAGFPLTQAQMDRSLEALTPCKTASASSSEQLSSPPLLPQQPRQPLRQPTPQSPGVGAICQHRWEPRLRTLRACSGDFVAYQQLVQDCAVWLAGCRQKLRNLQSAGRPAAHSSLEPLCRSFERALALRQSLRSARPDIDALNTAGGALAAAAQRYEAVDGGGGGSGGNAQQLAEELARVNADYAACVAGAEAAIASLRTGILQPAGLDPAASAVKEASEQQQQLQTVDSADPDDAGLVRARTRGHFGGADSASVRLGLSRLLDSGLARPGGVLDPCSGRLLTFAQAAAGAGSLLDTGVKEVVASSDAGKMTLAEACSAGVVDLATGRMRDFNTGDWLDFPEARRRGPAAAAGLLQSGNGENDGADLPRLLSDGVIDREQKALVLDCASSTGGGIERQSPERSASTRPPDADCRLQCQPEPQPLTVALAESRVLLHSEEVAVPFPDAVAQLPCSGARWTWLPAGSVGLPLATAVHRGLVSEQAAAALNAGSGLRRHQQSDGAELTVLEAAQAGVFDARQGQVVDSQSGAVYTIQEAASGSLLTADKAMLLMQLSCPVLLTSSVVMRPLDRARVSRARLAGPASVLNPVTQEAVTFEEAVKLGIVDPDHDQGVYVNHRTGRDQPAAGRRRRTHRSGRGRADPAPARSAAAPLRTGRGGGRAGQAAIGWAGRPVVEGEADSEAIVRPSAPASNASSTGPEYEFGGGLTSADSGLCCCAHKTPAPARAEQSAEQPLVESREPANQLHSTPIVAKAAAAAKETDETGDSVEEDAVSSMASQMLSESAVPRLPPATGRRRRPPTTAAAAAAAAAAALRAAVAPPADEAAEIGEPIPGERNCIIDCIWHEHRGTGLELHITSQMLINGDTIDWISFADAIRRRSLFATVITVGRDGLLLIERFRNRREPPL